MDNLNMIDQQSADDNKIIKLAILAVGGQGGGVLSNWIVAVAESNGYAVQSTSVAGVAQRTGATIYYVEMCKKSDRLPVFSLSPSDGDVDILISSELMEAGRAVTRGFVTPNRTTLITSSHRIAAVSEKIVPGDGRVSSDDVYQRVAGAALRFIAFDMEKMAVDAGSMISASLFGALAGSGALPFDRKGFEETIRASGRGVDASLRAFGLAYDKANSSENQSEELLVDDKAAPAQLKVRGPAKKMKQWDALLTRVSNLPEPVQDFAKRGLKNVVDYQDVAYGQDYLDQLDRAIALDNAQKDFALSNAVAKHLANAFCYDDMIRVADIKTRSSRYQRVKNEVGVKSGAVLHLTEFFHPRVEEFCGTMPTHLGHFIETRPKLGAAIDKVINHGRRIRTDRLSGFLMLWVIGGLRPWRRGLLRHQVETKHMTEWFELGLSLANQDYDLAVEIINCRRLIKGYSDTHVRGQSKFDRVLGALTDLKGRSDASDWIRRLREAALQDEKGEMLDGALLTVRSLNND